MAALRIACPSCKTVLQVGEPSFGKAVRCPKCQTVMKVPAAPPAKPPTAVLLPAVAPRPAAPAAPSRPRRPAVRACGNPDRSLPAVAAAGEDGPAALDPSDARRRRRWCSCWPAAGR